MNPIKALRKSKKLSQAELARILNVDQTSVSKWELGKSYPDISVAKKLSSYFHESLDVILDNQDFLKAAPEFPLFGTATAASLSDLRRPELYWPHRQENQAAPFLVRVDSPSGMEPRIQQNDCLEVAPVMRAESGSIIVVSVGAEVTVREYREHLAGISLIPHNPAFPIRFFTHDEIKSCPVRVIGRVVGLGASL